MPLPRNSQPAAHETRAVHTADIHICEADGTDVWLEPLDIKIGMAKSDCSIPKELSRMGNEKKREYGLEPPNPSALHEGVVPVILEHHACPSKYLLISSSIFYLEGQLE